MTKKHFDWFAAWIDQYPNLTMDYDALDDLMAYFHSQNKNFDHHKFLLACGFDQDEIIDIWGKE